MFKNNLTLSTTSSHEVQKKLSNLYKKDHVQQRVKHEIPYDFDVTGAFYFRLSELGQHIGSRILDVLVVREKGLRREIRVLNILLFIKSVLWKVCQSTSTQSYLSQNP